MEILNANCLLPINFMAINLKQIIKKIWIIYLNGI
jgi:hypothetical protein